MLESVAALQTHVLIPLCEHALRDLKALPPPSSPPEAASSSAAEAGFASAVRVDAAAVAAATGELQTLVLAPQTLPAGAAASSSSSGLRSPGDSPGSPLSAAVGRARRVAATDCDGSPEETAAAAARQQQASLPWRVRRVLVLLRDLFQVLDFTCAVVLGGSLR